MIGCDAGNAMPTRIATTDKEGGPRTSCGCGAGSICGAGLGAACGSAENCVCRAALCRRPRMEEQHHEHEEEEEEEEPGPEPEEEMHWQDGFAPLTPQDAPSSQADSDMTPPQDEAPPPPSALLQRWLAEARVSFVIATRPLALTAIRWLSTRREALFPLSPTLTRAS